MNIAFFLTPKHDVAWLPIQSSVRQAIERMEAHRYTAVPLLDREGRYAGTLTEGDLLRALKKHPTLTFHDTEHLALVEVELKVKLKPAHVDAEVDHLFNLALEQNFIPVVDDRDVFIGIVRRRAILEHLVRPHLTAASSNSGGVIPP